MKPEAITAKGCFWARVIKIDIAHLAYLSLWTCSCWTHLYGLQITLLSSPSPGWPEMCCWGEKKAEAGDKPQKFYNYVIRTTPHVHSLANLNCCPRVWMSMHTYKKRIYCLSPISKILIVLLGLMGLFRICKEKQGAVFAGRGPRAVSSLVNEAPLNGCL